MAQKAQIFCLSWNVLIVSSAVFISLSVSASEHRKCHWCGPLAEQVHRSRRAPSCDTQEHPVTMCDPGYSYCAVVVTSPPYTESRYCVKLYQDECYPMFCNSTKTWRMTCPCRGDLCNGIHTERENLAFQVALPKLVAKTHNSKIKKRTVLSSQPLISSSTNEMPPQNEAIITNDRLNETDYNTIINNTEDLESDEEKKGDIVISENNVTESSVQDITNGSSKTIEDNKSTEKIQIEITTPINNVENDPTTHATESPMITTENIRNDKSIISNEIKPSEVLPTAEALQQNASPVDTIEKQESEETTTQTTSMTTSITNTETHQIVKPTQSLNKNIGVQAFSHSYIIITLFISCIIMLI
ncbi:uncharacterized protein LOC113520257 isoform X2 [Galleria mellonella]|uniref:Uncharacterized protein LOC113520257 isoform X2 n=1 Tax=Galleria mellonella TaxID=7137 RepID=A0ABM3MRM1_GALME|nr:uncharacterized protein LOC113520257 isoform X2 [Galleria mellonella]